ncbi:STAM-binding protein isoform X2 [Adelges cooleyi]|nr:STAM-binding protein isoform X2 [Adelges cooleyi]
MIRMADVYLKENNFEQAYILYMKFMILFLEAITEHPDYKNVTVEERNLNNQILRGVLPKAENLKNLLKAQYTKEYELYKEQKAVQDLRDREALAQGKNDTGTMPSINTDKVTEEYLSTIVDNAHPEFSNSFSKNGSSSYNHTTQNDFEINSPTKVIPPSTTSSSYSQNKCSDDKPVVDRSTKPLSKSPYDLRKIIVPADLTQRFLDQAKSNTMKTIETCGILAGKLSSNSLIITHLMIPKQTGTSDSCTTMNEEDIFEFQDKKDLITLGWIHTHPTQTSFMSSVDLHTHYSYQLMMPEAIAIVCAPKYNSNNIFYLTPDHGLQIIANCKFVRGFHTHNTDGNIYTVAEHCILDNSLLVNLVDFR